MRNAQSLRPTIANATSDTRTALIHEIKQVGECTVEHLSECLRITPTAVRQHLGALERDGLVSRTKAAPSGVGRPGYVYRLTASAQDLFPTSYRQFAVDLVQGLIRIDGIGKVDELLEARCRKTAAEFRPHFEGKPFAERVATLARLRSRDGYMTEWEKVDEDTFLIREVHCPLLSVAEACPQLCQHDLSMFAELLDARVVMQEHMASGDRCCCYRVTRLGTA